MISRKSMIEDHGYAMCGCKICGWRGWSDTGEPECNCKTDDEEDSIVADAVLIMELLAACKRAKSCLEPCLTEPGRTVFWDLVRVIAKAEGRS